MGRCRCTALNVLLLSLMQLLVFFIVFLFPGISIITGYLALRGVFLLLHAAGALSYGSATSALASCFVALYAASFLAHVYLARNGSANFTPWVWKLRILINAFTMLCTVLVTAAVLAVAVLAPAVLEAAMESGASAPEQVRDAKLAGCFSIVYATTPFFLAMLHSPQSFVAMV